MEYVLCECSHIKKKKHKHTHTHNGTHRHVFTQCTAAAMVPIHAAIFDGGISCCWYTLEILMRFNSV